MNLNARIQEFKEFCRENKYKITSERIEILREVCSTRDHFDADDLLIKMKKKHRKVSRATIYRTLELLVEMRFLNRERLGGEQYLYECAGEDDNHYHCICKKCGEILEFTDEDVPRVLERRCKELGFAATHHNLKVFGTCKTCNSKNS
ncbi:MAG TPA: Fur family transcriptional regulator [Thermoanaerobaculia bacterium]|nr:Fur family transcriptional regulator [Thermoanaerobaculia bacterium]HXK66948.1 Fur family transcriptional regulator [Thermoanaerobaculia bacterium]